MNELTLSIPLSRVVAEARNSVYASHAVQGTELRTVGTCAPHSGTRGAIVNSENIYTLDRGDAEKWYIFNINHFRIYLQSPAAYPVAFGY